MRKEHNPGKTSQWNSRRRGCVWAFVGLTIVASGCRNPQHTAGDPLMGPVNPPGINGQPLPPQPTKAQSAVAPTPLTQSNNTPAGLVNNTQMPTTKPLTIGDPQTGPNWQLTNTTKDNAGKAPTVVPVPRDVAPAPTGVVPSSWNSNERTPAFGLPTSGDPLALLKARGAVGEQQEKVSEGIHLTCFLPSRANPANLRQYEVTAADIPTAVQAILRQIDNGK
ncbi:MAG: hypothetical protein HY040_16525 [Planctomycetes bacterium]|nr:hypothetical protein [Planctomycetota bacterium]